MKLLLHGKNNVALENNWALLQQYLFVLWNVVLIYMVIFLWSGFFWGGEKTFSWSKYMLFFVSKRHLEIQAHRPWALYAIFSYANNMNYLTSNNIKISWCLCKMKKWRLLDTKCFITICNLVRMTDLFNVQIQSVWKYRDNIFRAIFCQILSSGLSLDNALSLSMWVVALILMGLLTCF